MCQADRRIQSGMPTSITMSNVSCPCVVRMCGVVAVVVNAAVVNGVVIGVCVIVVSSLLCMYKSCCVWVVWVMR